MDIEDTGPTLQPDLTDEDRGGPGVAARAIDTATDVSRTIGEVTGALKTAVEQLTDAIEAAQQPGKPLATITAITREAPLTCLFVAFLFGVALTRRR
jgi:hypothetical protein